MKHIQKDCKAKRYIFLGISRPERCNCWRYRNDEDHTVPSVMKLIDKLTDEEVDEMDTAAGLSNTYIFRSF